jgi:ubiquitin
MSNLKLWDSFGKTDPKYTKAANVDGNKLTSLDGVYMAKLATEALGPIGEGWGYTIVEERMDNTKPIMQKGEDGKMVILKDGDSIVWEQNHTVLLEMWHGKRENVYTQFGHTKYRYMKTDGTKLIIDNEYAKKSVTDAMKKCLSLIGICADVFMGEFDDQSYQQAAKLENDLKKADDKDAEYASKTDQFNDFVEDKINAMSLCPNFKSMQSVYGMAVQKIDREAPILGINPVEAKAGLDAMFHQMNELLSGAVEK